MIFFFNKKKRKKKEFIVLDCFCFGYLNIFAHFRSHIKHSYQGDISVTAETPYILHCKEYKAFHVAWNLTSLRVGRGADIYDTNSFFMEYSNDELHLVQAVAFVSAEQSDVEFEIIKLLGMDKR